MVSTDLTALRMLVAIRDSGSITAASKILGVSQQAVSARMRGLENMTGLALFIRSHRGSELTIDGLLMAGWANELLTAARTFDSAVAALLGNAEQTLTVASSLTIAEHLLPRWLITMRAAQDRRGTSSTVALAATNSQSVIDLVRSGSHSLGFIETPGVPTDLASQTIASDELVLVVGLSHPWATRREGVSATELAATPLIVRESGSGTRGAFERALSELPTPLTVARPAAELPTTSSILTTVIAGNVPAVVSILAARDALTSGQLVRVKITDIRIVRPLTAVWLRTTAELPEGLQDLLRIATA